MRKTGALLRSPTNPGTYCVHIRLSGGEWARLEFSDQGMAQREYDRVRGISVYGERWVETITLERLNATTTPGTVDQ